MSIPVFATDGGALEVHARSGASVAQASVVVGVRTMESMQVSAAFDREWALPGESFRARVTVRDPTGVPLAGVLVRLSGEGREGVQERTTGADGSVEVPWQASALSRLRSETNTASSVSGTSAPCAGTSSAS